MKTFKHGILVVVVGVLLTACAKDNSDAFDNNSDTFDSDEPIFAIDIGNSNIPYIQISTSEIIQNEPKVAAEMQVYENGEQTLSTPIGIEYRGSTSFRLSDKKSYGIETKDANGMDVDVSVLDFPEEEDWILNGHVFRKTTDSETIFDPTLMHHYIGYQLFQSMGRYASRSKFIELEINGDYQGVYVFMEKLKRDENRINIAELLAGDNDAASVTGGYILKIDKTAGGDVAANQPLSYYENNWQDDATYTPFLSFRSAYGVYGNLLSIDPFGPPYHSEQYLETYFLYEYPKADNITEPQKDYIQQYIHNFETSLLNNDPTSEEKAYTEYIDVDSFVDFFIINEVTGNVDGYRLSTYLHKDRGKKLKMGPIWDLNIGYNRQNRIPFTDWIANYNTYIPNDPWLVPFWWQKLLEDNLFRAKLKERWQSLRANTLSTNTVLGLVDATANHLIENGAVERNYQKWQGIDVNYTQSVEELKSYLENRLAWMDETITDF